MRNLTPVDAFMALRGLGMPFIFSGRKDGPRRHSYVSAEPLLTIKTEGKKTVAEYASGNRKLQFKDPFEALNRLLPDWVYEKNTTFPFNSGAAGYFAYSLKDLIEPRRRKDASAEKGVKLILDIPDCVCGIYDPIFVYDHLMDTGYLVGTGREKERFKRFLEILNGAPCVRTFANGFIATSPNTISANVTKEEYAASIKKAQDYIAAGDIYQINISQRLKIPYTPGSDLFALYLKLLDAYPTPYGAFLDFGKFQIICNSPERLLKVKDGVAETGPIKGTRKRGATLEEDAALIAELKASVKERAEHVMIVDLERNDLGRVCETGSVEVSSFEAIATYPHLHHMVSIVRGKLGKGVTSIDALKSLFPGGSVTGAPKIRAMEIISELERAERGVYTGGVGWLDFDGNMDVSMAIRTAVCKDGFLYLNVGGGIVADSNPEDEYAETLLKARDFLDTMGIGVYEGK
ncbi:MAG: aminodeoxychorismate synthase component I [Deltaproteobacteria bacterium]|nr:aminodeoxychorismate synthase component I [Deltaproteobacteria bacterium]